MSNLYELEKFFPKTGNAEADIDFLSQAYLETNDFKKVLNTQLRMPKIIVGKKGTGKSALVNYLEQKLKEQNIPVLLLKPSEIEINFDDPSIGSLTRISKQALIKSIGMQIAKNQKKFLIEKDQAILNELARTEGIISDDLVQDTLKILKTFGQTVAGLDFSKFAGRFYMLKPEEIKRAVQGVLSDKDKIFYLIIDDTDQIATMSDSHHLNRIWSFLLATRDIMSELPNIKCFITLRLEIWNRLYKDDSGQRDQRDHFRGAIYTIDSTEEDIKRIIAKRMILAAQKLNIRFDKKEYSPFFEKSFVEIPSSNHEKRYWSDYISKRARHPRDAIQLIGQLIENAIDQGNSKINDTHLRNIYKQYAKERVDDVVGEIDKECIPISQIIDTFADCPFEKGFSINSDNLKTFIKTIPTRFNVNLFGDTLQEDERSIFKLWEYLFEIGFLGARVSDSTKPEGYNHLEKSDVKIKKENWYFLQKILWEIHPSFRDYLIGLIEVRKKMSGFAKK